MEVQKVYLGFDRYRLQRTFSYAVRENIVQNLRHASIAYTFDPDADFDLALFASSEDMLSQLVDDDSELISLYYGQDVHAEDAEKFAQSVEELYPDVDIDVHMGGQPIYYYVLSVE